MKHIVILALATISSWAGSVYGVQGLGEDLDDRFGLRQSMQSGEAWVDGKSFSLKNHAKNSLNTHTIFSAAVDIQNNFISIDNESGSNSRMLIPFIGLNFLSEDYGSLGFAYLQKRSRSFEYKLLNGTDSLTAAFEGGLSEVQGSYAWDYHEAFAVGAAVHYKMGRDSRGYQFTEAQNNWKTDVQEKTVNSGMQFSTSAHYSHKEWDIGLTYQHKYTLDRTTKSYWISERVLDSTDQYQRVASVDTVRSDTNDISIEQPWGAAAYLAWKLNKSNLIALDYEYTDGGSSYDFTQVGLLGQRETYKVNPSHFLGLGWSYRGSKRPFDPYYKKMGYRLGASWKELSVQKTQDYRASGGLGFPLGGRGSSYVEITGYGGMRTPDGSNYEEMYYGMQFQLSGLSKWGESRRRRR